MLKTEELLYLGDIKDTVITAYNLKTVMHEFENAKTILKVHQNSRIKRKAYKSSTLTICSALLVIQNYPDTVIQPETLHVFNRSDTAPEEKYAVIP